MKTIFAAGLVASLFIAPAHAQYEELEDGVFPATELARMAGFEFPDNSPYRKEAEERELIDAQIASRVARTINPDVPYGFGYFLTDLDGDGLNDLVLDMMIMQTGDATGVPVLVYLFRDGDWKLALESSALGVGVRASSRGTSELALVDALPGGFRRFKLSEDGRYEMVAEVLPPEVVQGAVAD